MKKTKLVNIFVLILMLVSISWSVLAEDMTRLDLKTAVNMALENNLELKIASIDLEKAKLEHQKKIANNLLQPSRYSKLETEVSLKSAQNTYQNTKDQIVNDTLEQYTNLWLASFDLNIKKKKAGLEKRLLEEAKAQYEIGDIGSVDLLEQENAYKDASFNLETANDNYQQKVIKFKTSLNLDNTKFVLSDLTYAGNWEILEDKAIQTALNNSVELGLKEDKLELARIDLERAQVSAAELDKEIKEKAVEVAKLDKENTKKQLVNTTQQAYYQYKQAVKNMGLKKESLNEAEKKYNLRKEQYDAGLVTSTEVLEYEVNMMQAKSNFLSAISDCYLKEQALRQKMNQELGVLADDSTEKK